MLIHGPPHAVLTRVVGSESHTRMAWKNGCGETGQVAVHPPAADFAKDAFLWRLSVSTVRASCSYSLLPGYDVALLLLDGKPLHLHHNGCEEPSLLHPLVPYSYRYYFGNIGTTLVT